MTTNGNLGGGDEGFSLSRLSAALPAFWRNNKNLCVQRAVICNDGGAQVDVKSCIHFYAVFVGAGLQRLWQIAGMELQQQHFLVANGI